MLVNAHARNGFAPKNTFCAIGSLAFRFIIRIFKMALVESAEKFAVKKINVKNIVNEVISNRKNSNLLIELEKTLLSEDEDSILLSMDGVQHIFTHILDTQELCSNAEDSEVSSQSASEKYKQWLLDRYMDFKSHLIEYTSHHENVKIQSSAVHTLMALLAAEGRFPIIKHPNDDWYFPKEFFKDIIQGLLQEERDMSEIIIQFKKYNKYDDIKLYVLKSLRKIFEEKNSEVSSNLLCNVFSLLIQISFPKIFPDEDPTSINNFIDTKGTTFMLKKKVFKRIFSSVWITFLKCKLPVLLYKKVLTILHHKVLPHLINPLLLTDFLTDSYNIGGVVSLLALNGLFYMIQNYNLEYPDFYTKLYSLFDVKVISSKFQARFFFLSDLFLSSTHLPAYLVASFIKRLSRLSLVAPPHILLKILPFVSNLLIRHPSLKVMIHCEGKTDVENDPYIFNEPDPAKSNALDSSLWEIKTLQSHWHPDVSKKAQLINHELPVMERDLSSVLELDINDLIQKEIKDFSEAPLSFDIPEGLFKRKEDKMNQMWTL